MIEEFLIALSHILLILGTLCILIGSIGFHRFPDFFSRLHAATVVNIGGVISIMLGCSLASLALYMRGECDPAMAGIALLAGLFLGLKSPISTHAISRAALKRKIARTEVRRFRK